jgi:hypothetical protein
MSADELDWEYRGTYFLRQSVSLANLLDYDTPKMIICYNSISYGVFNPLRIASGWYNSVKHETLFDRNMNIYVG